MLTEAGRALVADARRVGRLVDEMRARAAALHRGLEAEVGLAVDVMFPTARLVAALDAFAREYPTVALRLRIEGLGGGGAAGAGPRVPAWRQRLDGRVPERWNGGRSARCG